MSNLQEVVKKRCSACGEEKGLSAFNKHKNCKYGVNSTCKVCERAAARKRYRDNYEYYLQRNERYKTSDNTPEYKKCSICGETKHKNEFHKNSYTFTGLMSDCKTCRSKHLSEYRKDNTSLKEYRKKYREEKMEDLDFRLKQGSSAYFRSFIHRKNIEKVTYRYTGILLKDYLKHLKKESLWREYIKGNNGAHYGYNIDHIIPMSVYDFTKTADMEKCWNPKNLRIVTAAENMGKGDTIDYRLIDGRNIRHLLPGTIQEG